MAILTILVGLFLGFGAAQDFVERGVMDGLMQPALFGAFATATAGLLVFAGVAKLRRHRTSRMAALVAGSGTIIVHFYGVLPPHYSIGILAATVGVIYGVILLAVTGLEPRLATPNGAS